MKKLLFILCLFTITNLFSQTWKYNSGGNAFDGKYRTAYVQGSGTDFPYNKPLLTINLFNDDLLNFYIASAGYFQSESDISILWIFNNEPKVIYKTDDFSISKDNRTIFLSSFINTDTYEFLSRLDFINKLKAANKVDVRISDKYDDNDIVFKLSGSTKAINYVISRKYKAKVDAIIKEVELEFELLRLQEEEAKIKEEEVKKKQQLAIKKIAAFLNTYNLVLTDRSQLIARIERSSKNFNYDLSLVDSLNIIIAKTFSSDLNLYDINLELVHKIENIEYEIPNYITKVKLQRRVKDSIRILKLLKTHRISVSESQNLLKATLHLLETPFYFLSDYDSVSINLPSEFIEYPNIHLLNKKNKKSKPIPFAKQLIPEYFKQLKNIREQEIVNQVLFLLSKYHLTKEEELVIINNFNVEELFKIKASVIDKAVIVQNRKIPSLTKINLSDKFRKEIYSISIKDKSFHKLIKRKLSKL